MKLRIMKKLNYNFIALIFFMLFIINPVFSYDTKIDPTLNGIKHNNKGITYMHEGYLPQAIKEFQIAIELNPNMETTGIYYDNMGQCYMKLGIYKLAINCFELALKQNPMCFLYYQHLVSGFRFDNVLEKKKLEYEKKIKDNYLNTVIVALILIELGDRNEGEKILFEFIKKEPEIYISHSIKQYLKNINETNKKN